MRYKEFDRAVVQLDFTLDEYEQCKEFMVRVSLPVTPEQAEAIPGHRDEENVKAQKKEEDHESLQRIKKYFEEHLLSFGKP